jgi:hypothetical protein
VIKSGEMLDSFQDLTCIEYLLIDMFILSQDDSPNDWDVGVPDNTSLN